MSEQMMICPKAKRCECKAEDRNICPRATPHEYDYHCCEGSKFCPPCIKTDSEPQQCPEPMSLCETCKYDCVSKGIWEIWEIIQCDYYEPQPLREQMPLRLQLVIICNEIAHICPSPEFIDAIEAWHNAQTDKLYKEAFDKGMQIGKATQALEDNKALPAIRAEAVKQFAEKSKLIWYILDEIACKHSATHIGSGNLPCPICDRAEEAMKLCPDKPNPEECQKLFDIRAMGGQG